MNRPTRLVLPIDPQRPTSWAVAELVYCLGRDFLNLLQTGRRGWRRVRRTLGFRLLRALMVGGAFAAGAALDQHLQLVRLLIAALTA